MSSRAERLVGWNTLRGLLRGKGYVGMTLTLMLLIAAASYRWGRPELARSRVLCKPLKLGPIR